MPLVHESQASRYNQISNSIHREHRRISPWQNEIISLRYFISRFEEQEQLHVFLAVEISRTVWKLVMFSKGGQVG